MSLGSETCVWRSSKAVTPYLIGIGERGVNLMEWDVGPGLKHHDTWSEFGKSSDSQPLGSPSSKEAFELGVKVYKLSGKKLIMAFVTEDHIKYVNATYGQLLVLDDIIQFRKADEVQSPILAYPKDEKSVADYEYFTAQELDRLIDGNVKQLIKLGLGETEKKQAVGLLAPSTLDFVVTFFAVSRLGHTILTLSPRLAPVAIANLMKENDCHHLLSGSAPQLKQNVDEARNLFDFEIHPVPARSQYDVPMANYFDRKFDRETEHLKPCVIIHSSGSTGLPKSIPLSHRALLQHPIFGPGLHNFNALPWYHVHGIGSALQAMYFGKTAHMWNAALPMTAENVVTILQVARPGALHTVPYVLGLMAESDKGIELLRECKIVTAAGARTPDELGDKLVKAGVKFGTLFGMTEAGLLGDSVSRPDGDDAWDYIRIAQSIRKYVYFNCIDEKKQQYEAIYLKGHPALCAENTDFPVPGSWSSKDIFTPHPTIKDAWKYLSRIDDRVTLVNGEKVLPLPIEGRIRTEPLVRDCAVVGVDKPVPGLLAFRAKEYDHLSDAEFLDALWPAIADANSRAEAFSQISRDMVYLVPSNVDYPHTDKDSIIRKQVYSKFEDEIESLYKHHASENDSECKGKLEFDVPGFESFLLTAIKAQLGLDIAPDSDFFAAGVDSLKAIQLRRLIQENIALHGHDLPQNVAYNCGNVHKLSEYLHSIQQGVQVQRSPEEDILALRQMIEKYKIRTETRTVTNSRTDDKFSVILTGATGSIGAHLLSQLVALENVEKVYCFCRGKNASQRIRDSLSIRKIAPSEHFSEAYWSKIVGLETNTAKEDFGLSAETITTLKQDVGLIIHGAWPVNFSIGLGTFEEHIKGLHNLLQFSMDVNRPQPAQIIFCSSISTALAAPPGTVIPDAPIKDISYATATGYSQSKYVGEEIILDAARKGANAFNVRIGQIVGDTREGVWNDTDSYPLIIRAATVMKVIPDIKETCEWLPVDTLAKAIVEISQNVRGKQDVPRVFNFINPNRFEWPDLVRELQKSMDFTIVPLQEWLDMLNEQAQGPWVKINPATKLADYFAELYGGESAGVGGVTFEVKAAKEFSSAMKTPPDVLKEGLVQKFLNNWVPKWNEEAASIINN
ncbi:putative NRPS-like protein biosynthetic cluster [Ascosphaera pollenicola]|nr:putative NRPS-like protein biosynthetic cluster [Ascosphaera pollenicola]